jgi:D-lactate dehydrogenase (cytochrome)
MSLLALDDLANDLGDRWISGEGRRAHYCPTEGHHRARMPDRVAQPQTTQEVCRILARAHAAGIAVVPFGAGTSLEGNAAVPEGALCIDMTRMDRIIDVRAEDLLCVVEAGVTREQLNAALRATGLFFPIDPGANATLGGMLSTRASGTNAVRYGTMRENVLALKVAMPDGSLVETGCRARKSAAGYDLTHLFVGAEGTLGMIVEATLRLHGIPETIRSGTWRFATLDRAVEAVIATMQCGVAVARIELMDPTAIAACNAYSGLALAETPTLFVELHGDPVSVAAQEEQLRAIGTAHDAGPLLLSEDRDAQRALWRARHNALPAARALVPGALTWITDICVPISHLAEAVARSQRAIAEAGLTAPIVGHVGDGNYHVFFVLAEDDAPGWAQAKRINEDMIDFALSVGGTCTGEHGIGLGKRQALLREHGDASVALMRTIKQAIDPGNQMNPGKIFV